MRTVFFYRFDALAADVGRRTDVGRKVSSDLLFLYCTSFFVNHQYASVVLLVKSLKSLNWFFFFKSTSFFMFQTEWVIDIYTSLKYVYDYFHPQRHPPYFIHSVFGCSLLILAKMNLLFKRTFEKTRNTHKFHDFVLLTLVLFFSNEASFLMIKLHFYDFNKMDIQARILWLCNNFWCAKGSVLNQLSDSLTMLVRRHLHILFKTVAVKLKH